METRPQIVGLPLEPVDIHIDDQHGFLVADLPNGKHITGTSAHLLSALHELIFWDHLRSHAAWPIIHGGSLLVKGKRFLVVGDKGQGKSTLAIHLLARGHQVEGDEHVAIGEATVVARPRTLRVKTPSFAMVRGLPEEVLQTASFQTWDGVRIHALDPSLFGRPWQIAESPLDAILLLESNHGGRSVAKPVSVDACFERLMANGHFGGRDILLLAARLRGLAARTPGYSLRVGDLETAEWHITNIAACLT